MSAPVADDLRSTIRHGRRMHEERWTRAVGSTEAAERQTPARAQE